MLKINLSFFAIIFVKPLLESFLVVRQSNMRAGNLPKLKKMLITFFKSAKIPALAVSSQDQ